MFFYALLYYVRININGGKSIGNKKSQIVDYPAQ